MKTNIQAEIREFIRDESGQSVTEYGAIIAFVALIVAMVFGLARGTLFSTICQSYSGVVSQMDTLNSYAASSSS